MKSSKIVMAMAALAAVTAMAVPALVSGASVRSLKGYGGGNEPTFDPANFGTPVANAVLTTENDEQAVARMTEKGRDAARVAVEMANLSVALEQLGGDDEEDEDEDRA